GLGRIQIGPLGGPLADIAVDATTGAFEVPAELMGNPYRLVYQPSGDPVPHEVQWSFPYPHICVPHFGKPREPDAPAHASIRIQARPGPPMFSRPRVFSYGTSWSAGQAPPTPNPVDYAYSTNAKPIDGSLATLQSGTDAEMLVDYTGTKAIGGARVNVD